MLKRIKLENFFSFQNETTIELNAGVNVLLGINGSGKSNFIKALRLLYEGINGVGLEQVFLKEWSGFSSVAFLSEKPSDVIKLTYEFDNESIDKLIGKTGYRFSSNPIYEIMIHKSGGTSYYLEERLYCDHVYSSEDKFYYLDFKNGTGRISTRKDNRINYHTSSDTLYKTQELVLRQLSDPEYYLPQYTLKLAIDYLKVYGYFDTSSSSKIRQPGVFGTEKHLLPDGSNLAQILNHIKNHQALQYNKIQNMIKKINPHFLDTSFDLLGSLIYPVLREKGLSHTVGVQQISDGTLRYLLMLTILLNSENKGMICLDEPETGLHPDMTKSISDVMKDAVYDNYLQIIVATHSPLLLNCFEIEDILIFEKDDKNSSLVSKKISSDFDQWAEGYTLGQLWLMGKLGGKRW